jgi:hypothetical protein
MNLRFEWGKFIGIKEPQIYIPFDDMPHTFDPPSGFLATANSQVTNDRSPHPLTLEWADPYRAERIYRLLDGRNGLTRADMLAVQTDIYSEVDQEIGHRLAYAIDHTDGVDERLKKGADLMRSWDGRLTTDSAAASVVTQTRKAFWPLILEPKLGKDLAAEYRWAESDFAEEEIQELGRATHRCGPQGDGSGPRSRRCGGVELWKLARCGHRAPTGKVSAGDRQICRDRRAAAQRGQANSETGGHGLWAFAAVHHGLERRGWIDRGHCAG